MNIFLDYQILDHIYRIRMGTYKSSHKLSLQKLKGYAENGKYRFYMSQITKVEMLQGLENPQLMNTEVEKYSEIDTEKLNIANEIDIIWLSYPCSKSNDNYSRSNVSMESSGTQWAKADRLEGELKRIDGVSPGDARQVVSMKYGTGTSNTTIQFDWFVSNDNNLVESINKEFKQMRLQELVGTHFGTSSDFINSLL